MSPPPDAPPNAGADAASVSDPPRLHTTHKDVVNRLKRADGHLRTIIGMIEGGRPCVEVAQQMHAVVRALESAKAVLIHDHLDHCLEAAIGPTTRADRAAVEEFRAITRYL